MEQLRPPGGLGTKPLSMATASGAGMLGTFHAQACASGLLGLQEAWLPLWPSDIDWFAGVEGDVATEATPTQ